MQVEIFSYREVHADGHAGRKIPVSAARLKCSQKVMHAEERQRDLQAEWHACI
jgi:hypothetical protein